MPLLEKSVYLKANPSEKSYQAKVAAIEHWNVVTEEQGENPTTDLIRLTTEIAHIVHGGLPYDPNYDLATEIIRLPQGVMHQAIQFGLLSVIFKGQAEYPCQHDECEFGDKWAREAKAEADKNNQLSVGFRALSTIAANRR